MGKKNNNNGNAETTLVVPQHIQDSVAAQQATSSIYADCAELRVYNPQMNGKDEMPEANGKIYIGKPSEKIEYWTEIKGTILEVKKSFCGYIPNEYWGKDVWYTNEVWVWDKSIKLKGVKQNSEDPKDREELFVGVWSMDNFYSLIQDKEWPFFRKMAEAMDWSQYPVSWLDKVIMLYIKTDGWEVFRLNPKSSFWKWNNIKPWTIEQLKIDATNAYNKATGKTVKSIDLSHVKFKATVKQIEVMNKTFNVLDWSFDWFVEENLLKEAETVKKLITENNEANFPGTMGALPASAWDMSMKPKEIAAPEAPDVESLPF